MAWFQCMGGNGSVIQEPNFCGTFAQTGIKLKNGRYIYDFGTSATNKSYYPLKDDGTSPIYNLTNDFHVHLKLKHLQANISGYMFMEPLIMYTSTIATGNIFVLQWTDNNNVETYLRIPKTDLPLDVGSWYTVDVTYNAVQNTVTLTGSNGNITQTVTETVNQSKTLSNINFGNVDGYDLKLMFDLADCYWEQNGIIIWGNKLS